MPNRPESPEGDKQSSRPESIPKNEDLIGQNLRRVYDEAAAEPLPDKLKDLLDQLKKGGRS